VLEGPKVSQSELARRFGVSQPQICRIIKNRERILSEWQHNGEPARKRRREAGDAAVEAALLRWLEATRAAGLTVSAPLLQGKAKALAEALGRPSFNAGSTWLARFGARHNVALEVPAEQPAAPRWADTVLPDALHSYAPRDIYSCSETAVLLRASAGHRLALLLCANADGSEKVALLAVGQSARPRCLRDVNLPQMPWTYRASSAARITAPLFAEWLRGFDEAMGRRGRRVALLLADRDPPPRLALAHVHVVFVPPGAALLQPLERGAARELKGHYRRRLLLRPPAAPPSLLDALHVLAQAWGDVRPAGIAACFRAAGFSPGAPEALLPGPEQDEELDGSGEPEDAEMTELADWEGDTGEDGDTEEPTAPLPCPSGPEVRQSLATLRRYLERCATSPELFQAFYQLEDAVQAAGPV
ncbi:TIGD3 protein, partial [Crypturellus undulatus]|nr:TIGD3 protein [Crypturellus undulatus]